MTDKTTKKQWHPRVEMRWREPPPQGVLGVMEVLEQLWQCEQTGELWWRPVPHIVAWESSEP